MPKRTPTASINDPKKNPKFDRGNGHPYTGEKASVAPVPAGFVRFWPIGHPDHVVTVPMGPLGWRVARQATWEPIQRPWNLPITSWRGIPSVEALIDVIFDRWQDQQSVQPAWDLLIGQMNHGPRPTTGVFRPPPPVMVTRGANTNKVTLPKDDKGNRWVITSIEVDDENTVRADDGGLLRVEATVHLLQHFSPAGLRDSARTIRAAMPKHRAKQYTSKPGDTLLKIAREQLHDASRVGDLLKLNPKIRDPRHKLPAKTKIKLP